MQSSGEGEWLQRRFHSAVRACFAAGLPDVAPQATFTSLRAEHWTRLGDVTPEDAYYPAPQSQVCNQHLALRALRGARATQHSVPRRNTFRPC